MTWKSFLCARSCYFLRTINTSTLNQRGENYGTRFRPAIFYGDVSDRELAIELRAKEQKKRPDSTVLAVEPFINF